MHSLLVGAVGYNGDLFDDAYSYWAERRSGTVGTLTVAANVVIQWWVI